MTNQMYPCEQLLHMNKAQLLHFIDMVSFQVVDTQLFLDTHPCDTEALQHFHYYSELRNKALKIYAEKYGSLTIDTINQKNDWDWVKEPWPWEGGNC